MLLKTLCHVFAFLTCTAIYGQSSRLEQILDDIAQNNPQLLAYSSLVEGKSNELSATNGLPNFEVFGYYMPFGEHVGPDYYEIEIAQSFDFPSVYAARRDLISLKEQELISSYDQRRQGVLLPAKKECLELIYLNKRQKVVTKRVNQARRVMEQTRELFTQEQVGLIELNKSKVAWLQIRYSLDQINNERTIVLTRLEKLNGGQAVSLEDTVYNIALGIPDFEVVWEEYQSVDPKIRTLSFKEKVAAQQLTLAKRNNLPGITAGYNAQGFRGEYYAGFLAGFSLPLWKRGAKVNAAKALTDYQQNYTSAVLQEARGGLLELYQRYLLLASGLEEYRSTLAELGNEGFLREAYDQGEISFINFYQEAQFYWEAYDNLLLMERDIQIVQAQLTKHQL